MKFSTNFPHFLGRFRPLRRFLPERTARAGRIQEHGPCRKTAAFQRKVIFTLGQFLNGSPSNRADLGTLTLSSEVQSPNALAQISVTESGITTRVSEVQPKNAHGPILMTESGITTLASEVQPLNANGWITVIESGITTPASASQSPNANGTIKVTELGISTPASAAPPPGAVQAFGFTHRLNLLSQG